MEVVISGLDAETCMAVAGDGPWAGEKAGWVAPGDFLEAARGPRKLRAKRCVWVYRSPAAEVLEAMRSPGATLQETLETWFERQRRVLNLRQQLRGNLVLVNAAAHTPSADDSLRAVEDVMAQVLSWAAPRFGDMYASLEAAASSAGDPARFFHEAPPDENALFALLGAMKLGSTSPEAVPDTQQADGPAATDDGRVRELKQQLVASQQENDALLVNLQQVQEELEEFFLQTRSLQKRLEAEAQATAMARAASEATRQREQEARIEDELVVAQLHNVQEELHAHYQRVKDLDAKLAHERKSREAAESGNKALQAKLRDMEKELLEMAASQGTPPPATRSPGGRFARLVPGRVRARRARREAERATQAMLETMGRSDLFDRQWYLETYPDVKEAGMDPVKHYFEFGWKEQRNPGPGFDTAFYLLSNHDVARSGLNPLWHFIEYGRSEGRLPKKVKGAAG